MGPPHQAQGDDERRPPATASKKRARERAEARKLETESQAGAAAERDKAAVEVMEVGVLDEALCRGRATECLLPAVLRPSLLSDCSPSTPSRHSSSIPIRQECAHYRQSVMWRGFSKPDVWADSDRPEWQETGGKGSSPSEAAYAATAIIPSNDSSWTTGFMRPLHSSARDSTMRDHSRARPQAIPQASILASDSKLQDSPGEYGGAARGP